MTNDLISRSALKKDIDFEHICNCCNNHCGNVCDDCPISEIEKKIDNAPTVEEKSYAMGYQDGAEDGLDGIRPNGEWQDCSNGWTCSICYRDVTYMTNFCPHCGADMRGAE